MEKTNQQVIDELYSHGWVREYVKITEQDGGIKVKGGLTRMNWGEIKFELYVLGFSYDKTKKVFIKTHEEDTRLTNMGGES